MALTFLTKERYIVLMNTPKLSDREMFIYLIVSLIKDPTVAALDIARRTVILDEMRKKFCPGLTDRDWSLIADAVDNMQPKVTHELIGMMNKSDWGKLHAAILDRFTKNTGGFR